LLVAQAWRSLASTPSARSIADYEAQELVEQLEAIQSFFLTLDTKKQTLFRLLTLIMRTQFTECSQSDVSKLVERVRVRYRESILKEGGRNHEVDPIS